MSRLILTLTALLLLLSGCRTPRHNVEGQPSSTPEPAVIPPRLSTPDSVDESEMPNVPAVQPSSPWVAVSDWVETNGVEGPFRISSSAHPVFEIRADGGAFAFQIGANQARFDGMTLLLGFQPTVFAGQPHLHELDLANNLGPLLIDEPFDLEKYRVIVIDPGHGGSNTGTRSAAGDLEKTYTLDWALRLQPLLETNGWTVVLTRTNDSALTLAERVAFADAVDADLFISLHFNASGGGTHQSGLETYCLTPKGMPSSLTRGFEDDPNGEYPNNAFDLENIQLAARLHHALLEVNGGEDRGIRRARFMGVLRGQNRPSVLVEAGFLSNPEEAARIATPAFRQELAEAVAKGLGSSNARPAR